MAVDKSTVAKIAKLAHLRVPEENLDGLAGELNNILGWIEQLNGLDTDGVEPMTSVAAMTLPQRDDVKTDGGRPEDVLRNAPETVSGYFVVPKVVE